MKTMTGCVGLLAGGFALVSAGLAADSDWPQWRGSNRDGKVAGFTAPQAWPKELTRKWSATVGTGDATPALVGDKLYVFARQGENEVVLCLDAASGKPSIVYLRDLTKLGMPFKIEAAAAVVATKPAGKQ